MLFSLLRMVVERMEAGDRGNQRDLYSPAGTTRASMVILHWLELLLLNIFTFGYSLVNSRCLVLLLFEYD